MDKSAQTRRHPRFPLARSAPYVGKLACAARHAVAGAQGAGRMGNAGNGAAVRAPVGRSPGAVGTTDDSASNTEVSCNSDRAGTGKFAGTFVQLGAPGWDRTSNPCLRRAVLYPLSYGRFNTKARQPEGTRRMRRQSESERIPGFGPTVHRTAWLAISTAFDPPSPMRVNAC